MCHPASPGSSSLGNLTTNAPKFGRACQASGFTNWPTASSKRGALAARLEAFPRRHTPDHRPSPSVRACEVDAQLLGCRATTYLSEFRRKGGTNYEIALPDELLKFRWLQHPTILMHPTEPANQFLTLGPMPSPCYTVLRQPGSEVWPSVHHDVDHEGTRAGQLIRARVDARTLGYRDLGRSLFPSSEFGDDGLRARRQRTEDRRVIRDQQDW